MMDNSSSYPDDMNCYGATGRNFLNPVGMCGKSNAHDGIQKNAFQASRYTLDISGQPMVSRGKWLLIVLHYLLAIPFLCGAIYLLFEPWGITPEDGLVPLRVQLGVNDRAGVRATFISKWNETHRLSLSFPAMTGDIDIDGIVDLASKIGTQSSRPEFDFEWQVLRGETEIGRGSGKTGAIGASLGGDRLRTLIFGEFPLRAGDTYSATLSFGAGFDRFLRVSPLLQVRMANSGRSSALAFSRGLKLYYFIALSVLGLLLLSGGLRLQREVRAKP